MTASRVRQRIGAVMKWAVAQGLRADNPAGDAISAALPRTATVRRHQRALPHVEVRDALTRVRDCDASRGIRLAFEFLVLTATRSGEVRNARWEEIDHDAAVWTIPAARMKNGREHRVPLSDRALEVLGEASELVGKDGWVFPSPRGRVIPQKYLSELMHALHGVHGRAAGGLRTRAGTRQRRSRGSGLPAQRPVRETPRADGGVGRVRRLKGAGTTATRLRACGEWPRRPVPATAPVRPPVHLAAAHASWTSSTNCGSGASRLGGPMPTPERNRWIPSVWAICTVAPRDPLRTMQNALLRFTPSIPTCP